MIVPTTCISSLRLRLICFLYSMKPYLTSLSKIFLNKADFKLRISLGKTF